MNVAEVVTENAVQNVVGAAVLAAVRLEHADAIVDAAVDDDDVAAVVGDDGVMRLLQPPPLVAAVATEVKAF